LFLISADIKAADPKVKALKHLLKKVNERLPAAVYVPFTNSSLRLYNVLNIVSDESRVFSTKERAPFYICLEIFNPAESLDEEELKQLEGAIDKPATIRTSMQRFS
jgi:hypothetical protein